MKRNETLIQWIPWIQKNSARAFVKYDDGFCEMEDVFQEGCLAVAKRIDEGTHEPFHFLRAKRDISDFMRKQMLRKENTNLPYDEELNGKREKLCSSIDVKYAMSCLEKKERAILILSYWQDMSDREISEVLSIPQTTVSRWKRKAMGRLHEILH